MATYNKLVMLGNVTRNPEMKTIRGDGENRQLCVVGLAVNSDFQDGEAKRVDFFEIEFWGKQAENVMTVLSKGDGLLVEAKLRNDKWEDDSNQKHSRIRLLAQEWQKTSSPNASRTEAEGGVPATV